MEEVPGLGLPVHVFTIQDLEEGRARAGLEYLQFLKEPSMRLGLYSLAAGADDLQQPHEEDEVYYVLAGKGILRVGATDHPVETGSVVFVAARMKHKFHSITEPLKLLVFFAAN